MISHCNFNSIKVRLEHDVDYIIDTYMLFQFHKGTIRTKGLAEDIQVLEGISIP